jgi:hypothetical protein
VLENARLRLVILPALGAKMHALVEHVLPLERFDEA